MYFPILKLSNALRTMNSKNQAQKLLNYFLNSFVYKTKEIAYKNSLKIITVYPIE